MLTEERTLTCTYIDTCYPDYLTDHHNRDNEILLCAYEDEDAGFVMQQLMEDAFNSHKLPEWVTNGMLRNAIAEEFSKYNYHRICPNLNNTGFVDTLIYAYLSW